MAFLGIYAIVELDEVTGVACADRTAYGYHDRLHYCRGEHAMRRRRQKPLRQYMPMLFRPIATNALYRYGRCRLRFGRS